MREHIIIVKCDRCHQLHDLETKAESEETISVNGLARHLDLCETCRKEVVQPLIELMNTYGRRLDTMPAALKKTRGPNKKKLTLAEQGTPQPVEVPQQLGIVVGGLNEDDTVTCPCGTVIRGSDPVGRTYPLHAKNAHKLEGYTTCPTCQEEFEQTRTCSIHRVKEHGTDLFADWMRRVNDLLLTS